MSTQNFFDEIYKKNAEINISATAKEKYLYPENLVKLDSRHPDKKNFRRILQSNLRNLLNIESPTKENLNNLLLFCKAIKGFVSLEKSEIRLLYPSLNETQLKNAKENLKKYVAIQKSLNK